MKNLDWTFFARSDGVIVTPFTQKCKAPARHHLLASLPYLIITLVTTLEVNSAVSKIEVVTGTPPREYSVEKLY
jgi:hypothetical protein